MILLLTAFPQACLDCSSVHPASRDKKVRGQRYEYILYTEQKKKQDIFKPVDLILPYWSVGLCIQYGFCKDQI